VPGGIAVAGRRKERDLTNPHWYEGIAIVAGRHAAYFFARQLAVAETGVLSRVFCTGIRGWSPAWSGHSLQFVMTLAKRGPAASMGALLRHRCFARPRTIASLNVPMGRKPQ